MAKKKKTEPTFEHSFDQLQKIVERLESGNLTLGETLSSYESGIERLKECYRLLSTAENRIRLLSGVDENGNLDLDSFDSAEPKKGKQKAKRAAEEDHDSDEFEGLF